MDPVTAFGLAASVIQVAQFSASLISTCYQRYQGESSDSALHEVTSNFNTSMLSLQTMLSPVDPGSCCTKHEVHLLYLARESLRAARELEALLKQFDVDGNASRSQRWKQTIFRTAKREWKDADVRKKQAELEACRKQIDTAILVDLREQLGRLDIENQKGFANLERSVQSLVKELASHKTEILNKVESENQLTRTLITTEFHRLRLNDSASSRRDKVLKKLIFPQMETRENQVKDAHRHTFEWLFENVDNRQQRDQLHHSWNDFPQWLENGSSTYWISGKPGAGKSTLMRFIRFHPQTDMSLQLWADAKTLVAVHCFIYSGIRSVPLQYTVEGLLRSILYQLVEKLDHIAVDMCLQVVKEELEWQESTLKLALARIMKHYRGTVKFCFFIDGLDELCQGIQKDIREYLEFQDSLCPDQDVKVCVSSRPWQIFRDHYAGACSLRLQDLTSQDIQNFVNDTLNVDKVLVKRPDLDPLLMMRTTQILASKAEGVFLWAVVAATSITDGIQNGDSISELQQRVEELPDTLEDLYEHMFSKIDKAYRASASFQFLLELDEDCSRLPFTVLAFLHDDLFVLDRPIRNSSFTMPQIIALCENIEKRLLSRSGGILETVATYRSYLYTDEISYPDIDPEGFQYYKKHGVGFIHSTVVEFLKNRISTLKTFAQELLPNEASLKLAYARASLSEIYHLPWMALGVFRIGKGSLPSRTPVHVLHSVALLISEAIEILKTDVPNLRCELQRVSRYVLAQLREAEGLGVRLTERESMEFEDWNAVVFRKTPYATDHFGHHIVLYGSLPFIESGISPSRATDYIHCALTGIPEHPFGRFYKVNGTEGKLVRRALSFMSTMITHKADVNCFVQAFPDTAWGETAWQRLVAIVPRIKCWADVEPNILTDLHKVINAALNAGADLDASCLLGDTIQTVKYDWKYQRRFEPMKRFDLKSLRIPGWMKYLSGRMFFVLSPLAAMRLWDSDSRLTHNTLQSSEALYELMLRCGCAVKVDLLHLKIGHHEEPHLVDILEWDCTTTDTQGQRKDNWVAPPKLKDDLILDITPELQEKICSIVTKWLSDSRYPLNIKEPLIKEGPDPYSGELLEAVTDLILEHPLDEYRQDASEDIIPNPPSKIPVLHEAFNPY